MENNLKLSTLSLLGLAFTIQTPQSGHRLLASAQDDLQSYKNTLERLWTRFNTSNSIPVAIILEQKGNPLTWLYFKDKSYKDDDKLLHNGNVTSLCEFTLYLYTSYNLMLCLNFYRHQLIFYQRECLLGFIKIKDSSYFIGDITQVT